MSKLILLRHCSNRREISEKCSARDVLFLRSKECNLVSVSSYHYYVSEGGNIRETYIHKVQLPAVMHIVCCNNIPVSKTCPRRYRVSCKEYDLCKKMSSPQRAM